MTKAQEQRMNEVFNNYINERNFYNESILDAFKYGYQAATEEAGVLVQDLEQYCELFYSAKLEEALKKFKGE